MTYEELWEVAYSIGFHRGRLRRDTPNDLDAIRADVEAFEYLLGRIPGYWRSVAIGRHEQGIVIGEQT